MRWRRRPTPVRAAEAETRATESVRRWDFEEATAIAPGRLVLKRLGGGTRYEVYVAWDDRLCALVVVKVLRPDQAGDARALEELRREAALVERLAHPVLLRGFGAVLEGPHPHIVIEHLEGPTLRRLIKREARLPLEQILPTAVHIASALHYLSVEGVVHLDVKPSNIVMGVPPRLIDLSIARPVEQAARLRAQIGTDAYMAPEQCDPITWEGRIGPAADVWGLGATLHHAISGEPPFPRLPGPYDAVDPARRFPQLVAAPVPLGRDVPAPLADLVAATLARDPAQRPTAMEVVASLEPLAIPRRRSFRRTER